MGKTIVVKKTVEDLTPSESEKMAEADAKNRIELLGVVSCKAKKPSSRSRRVRVIGYGRGKTIHADVTSSAWKDYQAGRISITELKEGFAKAPAKQKADRPAWLVEMLARREAAFKASKLG